MLASAAFRHLTLWGWLVVVLTTNQSPLYGAFSVNRCVRAYREKASAAYARTQQNAKVLLYRGVAKCQVDSLPRVVSDGKRHLPAPTQFPKMGIRVGWPLSDRLSACYHFGNRQNQLVNLANWKSRTSCGQGFANLCLSACPEQECRERSSLPQ